MSVVTVLECFNELEYVLYEHITNHKGDTVDGVFWMWGYKLYTDEHSLLLKPRRIKSKERVVWQKQLAEVRKDLAAPYGPYIADNVINVVLSWKYFRDDPKKGPVEDEYSVALSHYDLQTLLNRKEDRNETSTPSTTS